MAEDWDLHAVVRGCASTNPRSDDQNNVPDELETDFDSHVFENDEFNFYDSSFNEDLKLGGLEEIYTSYVSPQQPQLTQPYAQAMAEPISPSFHSPPLQSASRRRKNQQTKVVREMTHEELHADSWAWRKYGQKPIKGSPYPRNYYKCSTSKGCIARKQVEKSPVDPNIYIVSYSGDHSHPRPVHRNALAGSTRNKSSTLSAPSFSMSTEGKSDSSREIRESDDVIEMEEDEDELEIPNDAISEDTHMGFEEHYSSYYTK